MKIEIKCQGHTTVGRNDLRPFQGNLKSLSEGNYVKLKGLITQQGFSFPIFVWRSEEGQNFILDGHQRVRTLQKMKDEGWEVPEIPVALVEAVDYSEAKKKLLAAASQFGKVEGQGLYEFITEAEIDPGFLDENYDLPDFDIPDFLDEFFDAAEENKEITDENQDELPDLRDETDIQVGQIFRLGKNRLMCGDSTMTAHVGQLLDGAEPELMFTDPPYGVEYDPSWREIVNQTANLNKVANDDRADWTDVWAISPCKVAYVWHAGLKSDIVKHSLEKAEFEIRSQIIWVKPALTFSRCTYHWQHEPCWFAVRKGATSLWGGDRKQSTTWEAASPINAATRHAADAELDAKTIHPTQKPVALVEKALRNHTCKEVYEPFSGSGSTLIGCEKVGKVFFGMELDPRYCQAIIDRWEKLTGGKAERVSP